jgi:hypothetical protein
MNEAEALREIRRVARTGLIILSPHAQRRMQTRNVRFSDVRHALQNATTVKRSTPDHASDWTATGPDLSGDELTAALILQGGVLVVTVY